MANEPETKPEEKPEGSPKNDKPLRDKDLDDVSGGVAKGGCGCMGMPKDPVG